MVRSSKLAIQVRTHADNGSTPLKEAPLEYTRLPPEHVCLYLSATLPQAQEQASHRTPSNRRGLGSSSCPSSASPATRSGSPARRAGTSGGQPRRSSPVQPDKSSMAGLTRMCRAVLPSPSRRSVLGLLASRDSSVTPPVPLPSLPPPPPSSAGRSSTLRRKGAGARGVRRLPEHARARARCRLLGCGRHAGPWDTTHACAYSYWM